MNQSIPELVIHIVQQEVGEQLFEYFGRSSFLTVTGEPHKFSINRR